MNATRPLFLLACVAVFAAAGMGCTIAATPGSAHFGPSVQTTHVVHHTAPTRVYHQGRWLHYRSGAYHYRSGATWSVARQVPSHVVAYHRPGRPVHVVSTPTRPTHVRTRSVRPTHVRTSTPVRSTHSARPGSVRTTRSSGRTTRTTRSSRSARPTHVRRTTSHRRTYRP